MVKISSIRPIESVSKAKTDINNGAKRSDSDFSQMLNQQKQKYLVEENLDEEIRKLISKINSAIVFLEYAVVERQDLELIHKVSIITSRFEMVRAINENIEELIKNLQIEPSLKEMLESIMNNGKMNSKEKKIAIKKLKKSELQKIESNLIEINGYFNNKGFNRKV